MDQSVSSGTRGSLDFFVLTRPSRGPMGFLCSWSQFRNIGLWIRDPLFLAREWQNGHFLVADG